VARRRVAAVILAAGESTRMGSPKPAMAYGSTTMVGAAVRAANAAELEPVIVVTGFYPDAVSEAVGGSAQLAHNPRPESGNLSSLLVGLDAVEEADGAIVLLADNPEVRSDVIADLAAGLIDSGSSGGWVEYTAGRGHPIALARRTFDDLGTLTGPRALWPFLSSLSEEDRFVLRVDAPQPIDVNTPEDYERITRSGDRS
jgi:molybdenum cofactor cytidylyltransferase